jgi:hypothetical protein
MHESAFEKRKIKSLPLTGGAPVRQKNQKMCFKLFLEKSAYSEKMENKNWQNFCFFFVKNGKILLKIKKN